MSVIYRARIKVEFLKLNFIFRFSVFGVLHPDVAVGWDPFWDPEFISKIPGWYWDFLCGLEWICLSF